NGTSDLLEEDLLYELSVYEKDKYRYVRVLGVALLGGEEHAEKVLAANIPGDPVASCARMLQTIIVNDMVNFGIVRECLQSNKGLYLYLLLAQLCPLGMALCPALCLLAMPFLPGCDEQVGMGICRTLLQFAMSQTPSPPSPQGEEAPAQTSASTLFSSVICYCLYAGQRLNQPGLCLSLVSCTGTGLFLAQAAITSSRAPSPSQTNRDMEQEQFGSVCLAVAEGLGATYANNEVASVHVPVCVYETLSILLGACDPVSRIRTYNALVTLYNQTEGALAGHHHLVALLQKLSILTRQ
ncbi:hypothetical protein KIPB_003005, partial [Kipferlia bialata]